MKKQTKKQATRNFLIPNVGEIVRSGGKEYIAISVYLNGSATQPGMYVAINFLEVPKQNTQPPPS